MSVMISGNDEGLIEESLFMTRDFAFSRLDDISALCISHAAAKDVFNAVLEG